MNCVAMIQGEQFQGPQVQGPQLFDRMNHPLTGLGQFPSTQESQQVVQPESLDSLFSCTIKCRQFKAVDFCKLGNFSYTGQIKQSNMNLALYAYGSVKHFLALKDGTLPNVEPSEFISRLQHTLNVLEMVCLGSSLSDFDTHSWKIGKEYDKKIIRDIEQGFKSWQTLDRSIDPTAWAYARELVPPKPRINNPGKTVSSAQIGSGKVCTTWNTFRKEGCHYEFHNQGETCVFQHFCSKCKVKGLQKKHKAWQCNETDTSKQPPAANTTAQTVTTPTTSG